MHNMLKVKKIQMVTFWMKPELTNIKISFPRQLTFHICHIGNRLCYYLSFFKQTMSYLFRVSLK